MHAPTAWGRTDVLRADGRTSKLADLEVGDAIYGTELSGRYRRFVPTRVLDKWSSVKPAFVVTLDDGTELIASGDHRFLSRRGWKHVAATGTGKREAAAPHGGQPAARAGGCVAPPEIDADYRRGYSAA